MAAQFSNPSGQQRPAADTSYTNFEDDASATASVTIDVDTNFDPKATTTHQGDNNFDNGGHHVSTDESCAHSGTGGSHSGYQDGMSHRSNRGGQGDGEDDGDDSHFSDIAQAVARATENIDMDKLCSELFTQEMLEEVVGAQAGVTAARKAAPSGTRGPGAGATAAVRGFVARNLEAVHPNPAAMTVVNRRKDCSSTGSDEVSEVTVPSTIAVPRTSSALASKSLSPQLLQPQLARGLQQQQLTKPALKQQQGAIRQMFYVSEATSIMPSSSLQFCQSSKDVAVLPLPAKKQRRNNGAANAVVPQATAHITVPAQDLEGGPVCVKCQFPGADLVVRCPSGGCAYHARCMDLVALCKNVNDGPTGSASSKGTEAAARGGHEGDVRVTSCPHCARPADGVEILPLSFVEMDRVQQAARAAFMNSGLVVAGRCLDGSGRSVGSCSKRSRDDLILPPVGLGPLPTIVPSHSGTQPRRTVQCYDPSQPRTGRWTDEEISFRDTLISHFLSGSLPLSNGLKLNDFLPVMLKSKQSRLAKKMKHAKLSTKYFFPKACCVPSRTAAAELSRLERDFLAGIPDPVERSEVRFHMSSQWREHFASRCAFLRIQFDGRRWLGSVEDMERRLAFEKERHRLAKRRFMMGKAMEKDCDSSGKALERGVFVRTASEEGGRDEFELAVEKSVSNSARGMNRSPTSYSKPYHSTAIRTSAPIVNVAGDKKEKETSGQWSSNEPNFKHAAPFLAGIASYIERNCVPFEHVDVWVPSFVEDNSASKGSSSPGNGNDDEDKEKDGAAAPGNFRLCFGGSVTMGVQIVDEPSAASGAPGNDCSSSGAAARRMPIPPETKSSLSLFGLYSEKFSFSSGCGLPGRIFRSGVPAWEQFVSEAPASQFERSGGAMQFGVKTAVGLPVDSPNVGRVVLVMYSRYDRKKDESLVGRLMVDLKLLCPSPRWKLVVDVELPLGGGSSTGVNASDSGRTVTGTSSSLEAPPPVNTNGATKFGAGGSPAFGPAPQKGPKRTVSAGSGNINAANKPMSTKDRHIKDLLLLLASNIPSSPDSPNSPLAEHIQSVMSLRLILLRGNARAPEEEALVDMVLVLYESYLHAGRDKRDIALMVARDFEFHLGHQRGSVKYGATTQPTATVNSNQAMSNQSQFKQGFNQGPPPNMYAVAQVQRNSNVGTQARGPAARQMMPNMGNTPSVGPIGGYEATTTHPEAMNNVAMMQGLLGGFKSGVAQQQPPLMGNKFNSPLMCAMGSPHMGPIGGYNMPQQQHHASLPMMGMNFNNDNLTQQQQPRSLSTPFLNRQNSSVASFAASPRSAASG